MDNTKVSVHIASSRFFVFVPVLFLFHIRNQHIYCHGQGDHIEKQNHFKKHTQLFCTAYTPMVKRKPHRVYGFHTKSTNLNWDFPQGLSSLNYVIETIGSITIIPFRVYLLDTTCWIRSQKFKKKSAASVATDQKICLYLVFRPGAWASTNRSPFSPDWRSPRVLPQIVYSKKPWHRSITLEALGPLTPCPLGFYQL